MISSQLIFSSDFLRVRMTYASGLLPKTSIAIDRTYVGRLLSFARTKRTGVSSPDGMNWKRHIFYTSVVLIRMYHGDMTRYHRVSSIGVDPSAVEISSSAERYTITYASKA